MEKRSDGVVTSLIEDEDEALRSERDQTAIISRPPRELSGEAPSLFVSSLQVFAGGRERGVWRCPLYASYMEKSIIQGPPISARFSVLERR
jgi:hypothetical protein